MSEKENAVSEKSAEEKVAREVAKQDFERFLDAMGMELDPDGLNAEDKLDLEELTAKLTRLIQKGCLIINDSGEAVYHLRRSDGPPIVFKEPCGADLMQMDKKKAEVGKMTMIMAAITSLPPGAISKLMMKDHNVVRDITILFMGAE